MDLHQAAKKLLDLVKDEAFFQELGKWVTNLQNAGIKEKNIAWGDLKGVRKIRIGDKEYSPDETFECKKNPCPASYPFAGSLTLNLYKFPFK